jgi:hypothetical protein
MGSCLTKPKLKIIPKHLIKFGTEFRIHSEYLKHIDEETINFLWKYKLICDERQQPYIRSTRFKSESECFIVIPMAWEYAEMVFDFLGFSDYAFNIVKLNPEVTQYQPAKSELDLIALYKQPFTYNDFVRSF